VKQTVLGPLASAVVALCVTSCGGNSDDTDNPAVSPSVSVAPGTSVAPSAVAPGMCLTATDANGNLLLQASEASNYSLPALHLNVQTTAIKPSSFITLDWSGLTQDFLKQPLDPKAGIDLAAVVLWRLTYDQIITQLDNDTLGDEGGIEGAMLNKTANAVSAVSTQGMSLPNVDTALKDEEVMLAFDVASFPPDQFTYTVMLNHGTQVNSGVRMLHTLKLDPASQNTTVNITNESTLIDYTVDLHTKPAVLVPAGSNAITVDWSQMQTNAMGRPFTKRMVIEVRVDHVPLTPAEIEGKFLGLASLGDKTFKGAVTKDGTIALNTLTDSTGAAFTGIDPSLGGTWLLALMCNPEQCGNPAPWYMARLEACQ
jgi:hypothetical protein